MNSAVHDSRVIKSSRGIVVGLELDGVRWEVRYAANAPDKGLIEYDPPRITLREWDSEVFLHESLHALCSTFSLEKWMSLEEEEQFIRHVSRGLDALGYRLEAVAPRTQVIRALEAS